MQELELVPLCSARLPVGDVLQIDGTPTGNLMVGELRGCRFEGERFSASQRGAAAADWLTVTPSGVALVDVRLTVETDDGALVHIEYAGRSNLATGIACTAPLFRTGDERYAWLNGIQAIARGRFDPEAMCVTYPMIYEVR